MPDAPRSHMARIRAGQRPTHRLADPARHRQETHRASAHARGYGRRWQRNRLMYLARHPLCADCFALGRTNAATDVHHILPLSAGGTHAWSNLRGLCKAHHSRQTAGGRRRP